METSLNYNQILLNTHIRKALGDLGYEAGLVRKLVLKPYSVTLSLDWQPDYTLTTFEVARRLSLAPSDLATKIATLLESQEFIKKARPAGPYINFALADDFILKLLAEMCSPKILPNLKETTLFEIGNVSIGEHIPSSLLYNLIEATKLSRILARYNKPSKIVLRLDDWDFSAASIILGETSETNIPIRKLRQIDNKLQSHDKDEFKKYALLREKWLRSIGQEVQNASLAEIQFIGNYDIHDKAISLINALVGQSTKIVSDPDSLAVYIKDDSVVIPIISQDGRITIAGYDLSSILINEEGSVADYVIYEREDFVIPKYVIKSTATKINVVIKKPHGTVNTSKHLVDLIVKTKTLGKPKNSYSPIDLSVLDRTLAAKLILYPSIIGEAAEKLNIGVLEEYIKTIVQLIKPNDSTSINSIENVTVHDTLQLVVQDISEILTT